MSENTSTSLTSGGTFNGVYITRSGCKAAVTKGEGNVITEDGKLHENVKWDEKGNCHENPAWDLMRREKVRTT